MLLLVFCLFFLKKFDYYYIYLFAVCSVALGSRGRDMPWHMCGQEDNFWALGVGFLFTMWLSRIEFRLSDRLGGGDLLLFSPPLPPLCQGVK